MGSGCLARALWLATAQDLQFSQFMQEDICSSLQFLQRTDALAAALNCRILDLPTEIGISERSLFGYRAGKYPVTAKALRKLQAAEERAGLAVSPWKMDDPAVLREDPATYQVSPNSETKEPTMAEAFRKIGEALDILKHLMENMPKDPKP